MSPARGDLLIYKSVDGRRAALQGSLSEKRGNQTISFDPTGVEEELTFPVELVEDARKSPTNLQLLSRRVARNEQAKDADGVFNAALWALKRGMLKEFYSAVSKTLDLKSDHAAARRVVALKQQMDEPLADSSQPEEELRAWVKKPGMKLAKSKHFVLLHDTSEAAPAGQEQPRFEERLELLERAYETFLLIFHAGGVELEVPGERLKAVLFADQKDYVELLSAVGDPLSGDAGCYSAEHNTSVFCDQGVGEDFKGLVERSAQLSQTPDEGTRARFGTGDLVRLARTLQVLVRIAHDNERATAVSRHATRQMAASTGLFPSRVLTPVWMQDGLATYFEVPYGTPWRGIGAVSDRRLEAYRALQNDAERSRVGFIASDQVFSLAGSPEGKLQASGQSWALTHYLLEEHFADFVKLCGLLGAARRDAVIEPDLLIASFSGASGEQREAFDREWKAYMESLKSDLDQTPGSSASRGP